MAIFYLLLTFLSDYAIMSYCSSVYRDIQTGVISNKRMTS